MCRFKKNPTRKLINMFSDFTYSLKELKGPFLDSHYLQIAFFYYKKKL